MEILFLLSTICLIAFMLLATYDGAYLHLWKFELFNHKESKIEHKIHTVRAILFPLIIWLLFVNVDIVSFYIGLFLFFIDLIVLGLDAFFEKESRSFMNGLPKWEYILHLFANSFHFTAIVLLIAVRVKFENYEILYSKDFMLHKGFEIVQLIAKNIIPGAIILAIVHLLLSFEFGKKLWNTNRLKITCC